MQSSNNNSGANNQTTERLQLQSAEAIGLDMEIAGLGARSHAFVIDWHIRLLLAITWIFSCGVFLFTFQGLTSSAWEDAPTILLYIWLLPAAIVYFFYHPVLEIAMSGRTPGKRMTGVKLVTFKGLTPDAGAILIRNVFRLLDSLPAFYVLGIATVAFTRHQVRIGDLAAKLVLVYDNEVSRKELQQLSHLVLNSRLNPGDQALLLDLLKRWKQLKLDDRIRLGEQFLVRIGEPIIHHDTAQKKYEKFLLTQLEQLANIGKP